MKNILMNVKMTKAILDGRKVQTRRVIKTMPIMSEIGLKKDMMNYLLAKSKYQIGETIWVREPAKVVYFQNAGNYGGSWTEDYAHVEYLADNHVIYHWDEFPENPKSWLWECKGIPNGCCKSLARIFLKITNVRVERLRDISTVDIYHEGLYPDSPNDCPCNYTDSPCNRCWNYSEDEDLKEQWINLWNKTAPKGCKWEDNPYVFVYEFERVEQCQTKY